MKKDGRAEWHESPFTIALPEHIRSIGDGGTILALLSQQCEKGNYDQPQNPQ